MTKLRPLETDRLLHPGAAKRKPKDHGAGGRHCPCGKKLGRWNPGPMCYTCTEDDPIVEVPRNV